MVFDVAAFIIDLLHDVTVSKLQLLLYYCQAWSLVWDDMPAFPDSIIAGPNGPYVERIKETFRGEFTIGSYPFGDGSNLSEDIRETCRAVIEHYGRYNAQQLIFLAESELPWKQAREKSIAGSNPEMSLAEMTTFYSSLLQNHEQK